MAKLPHGDNTIRISIAFFANDLPNKKMAWQQGVVRAVTNRSRRIREDDNPIPFNRFEEIPEKIKQVLKRQEIVLMDWERGKQKTRNLQVIFPKE